MITLASQLLEKTVSSNASDVFIVAGLPVPFRDFPVSVSVPSNREVLYPPSSE